MAKKVKPKAEAKAEAAVVLKEGPLLSRVLGHDEPIRILSEAIAGDRLPGTLLFVGPSGIGKRLVAQALAQALICENRTAKLPSACGKCGPCIRVATGNNENVLFIEQPGATGIKIEQAHEILQFISLQRLGRARVIIINDAHLLNPQAGNALLKSLEEPPPETYFILVTSHPGSMLTTIRSRAQTVRFQALSEEILKSLQPKAPAWLIRSSQGSLETIHKLQENASEWESTRRLALGQLGKLVSGETPETDEFREAIRERATALFVSQTWLRALRDFAVTNALNGDVESDRLLLPDHSQLSMQGTSVPLPWLLQLESLCLELEQDINRNVDRTLAFENFAIAVRRAYSGTEPRPMLG